MLNLFFKTLLLILILSMTVETLNEKFGMGGNVQFHSGKGGLKMIAVTNKQATATLALYGGHLLSYQPVGQKDILWMSEKSLFENGKAIRGGIPVCFPWFGPHPADKTKPQHGFARLQEWQVNEVKTNEDESTLVSLNLQETNDSLQLWPFTFNATLDFIIGKTLEVKLTVTNTGDKAFEYSDALHTYFNISDIAGISIEGLQNATYYDGFEMDLKIQQSTSLKFETETNRRYINHSGDCIINDTRYNRKIKVTKNGSKVTVVWNPGEAVTKTIGDMVPDSYKTFVCVEPANAYPGIDMIALAAGESHTLSTTIQLIE
jgi:glucose-6-phosphate 1-epimerase